VILSIADSTSQFRTDFPRPEMVVSCLSDGVQVEIHITERGFNGMLYVKGHSKDENCRRFVTLDQDTSSKLEIFKVTFGNCGLIHNNVSGLLKSYPAVELKMIFLLTGRSKLCACHTEASQAGDVQGAGLSHQVRVHNWGAERDPWLQRVHADHRWNHRQHWTSANLHHEDCRSERT
jgi:hypothetical protein